MTTNKFAVLMFLALASGGFCVERPNIVLCMADDQGWEETGYNGHPIVRTPILDEMAAHGLRFDRFYSAAPNCGPTRGSIMTGRHPNRFGLFAPNWAMRPEEITLAAILKKAGYATGHFGKWHLGPVKAGAPNNPGNSGFDEWLSHDNFFEMNPVLVRNGAAPTRHEGESSGVVVEAAMDFIARATKAGKPFFVVVWFGSPHGPYIASDSDRKPYQDRVREELAHRYGEITAMDRAIGMLRNSFRKHGAAANTLFWYCSDNGIPRNVVLQPKLNGAKGTLYEGGLRVPGIIEWPAVIDKPRVSSAPAVTTDILPTICDLLDLPLPDRKLDGVSLAPAITGKGEPVSRAIPFWRYNPGPEKKGAPWLDAALQKGTTPTAKNPGIEFLNFKHPEARVAEFGGDAALIDDRYKLFIPRKGSVRLFDLVKDPGERENIAKKRPDHVGRMIVHLRAWQRSEENSLTGADY